MSDRNKTERQPVVAVLGHVDHGKSTLLDYIRKTNVTASEAGGITQHVGAYEVEHQDESGVVKRITFIDTPGHSAFGAMRKRGADVADIAVLVVAVDDGVKPQTIEAITAIKDAQIPFIVAITKIDKPSASVDKTKQSLAEADVYVEGYGGTVPYVEVSGKTGVGVDTLLDLILLQASLDEFTTESTACGKGVIIESHRDAKSGTLATIIVTEGTLKRGDYIVIDAQMAVLRTLSDWSGKALTSAGAGRAVISSGFATVPNVGEELVVYPDKPTAQSVALALSSELKRPTQKAELVTEVIIPIIIKADTTGTLEAVMGEIEKRGGEKLSVKIVGCGVGNVAESDIKILQSSTNPLVIAFNISVDRHAKDLADKNDIPIEHFNVIYELTEWLDKFVLAHTPVDKVKVTEGLAKILKIFSKTRDKQVVGGIVLEGELRRGKRIAIIRKDEHIGEGKLSNLQKSRVDADLVGVGEHFGAVIEARVTLADGDVIEI